MNSKNTTHSIRILILVLGFALSGILPWDWAQNNASAVEETAEYRLTFDAVWSSSTHPTDFPPSPHFSGLVGGTHNSSVAFWEVGALASTGIEKMAELGSKTSLISEVNAAITGGDAGEVISGSGIGLSPGSAQVTFTATQDFPLATVVTMIAPSPDWFVGVSGLELFNGNVWKDEVVVSLQPFDSGTDSGVGYTSPNNDTQPPETIFEITGYPFEVGGSVPPLGTFTFTRIYDPSLTEDVDTLSAGGGTVNFSLDAGPSYGLRNYILLGSLTGTQPGVPLPGGQATLCINWDDFTRIVFQLRNTILFKDFLGTLDASGQAVAQMNSVPLDPMFIGTKVHFAYCLLMPYDFASNPREIVIVP